MTDLLTPLLALSKDEKMVIAAALALDCGYKLEKMKADPDALPPAALKAGVTQQMVDEAIGLWNRMAEATEQGNPAHKLAKVRKLNAANRKTLARLLSEFGADGWRTCVEAVYKSAHCRGINDRGWKADISYLLQSRGSNKTLNGGWPADYQERTRDGQRAGPAGRGDQRLDGLRGFDAAIREGLAGGGGREDRRSRGREEPEAPRRGEGQALLGFDPRESPEPE